MSNLNKRIFAMLAAGIVLLPGCGKVKENTKEKIGTNMDANVTTNNAIVSMVDDTENKIDKLLPKANDEVVNNASIMLLLDIIAKEDENGKISANDISKFKSKLDVDDMMNEFNSFLDMIGYNIKSKNKVQKVSAILPKQLNNDKILLGKIEDILEKVIKYSREFNKEKLLNEFNKIYTLFVEEKEIEIDGIAFEERDLTFPCRAVANKYAETVAYYSRNYISDEKYAKLDDRTNDQNNKAYIKTKLEILANQMEEKSEVDVISLFNNKYREIITLLDGKVNLSDETIKNIVNYMNLKYVNSDKVATKDMNALVGEYDNDKISDVLTSIQAINTYNFKNQTSIIPYSAFLVNKYLETDTGKIDVIALNFVQYNTIMMNNTLSEGINYLELSNNPYFKNIFKYFTKQDFKHVTQEGNKEVLWQNISDGTNFVNNQIILNSLNKLPNVENKDDYIKLTQENLGHSIQYLQNTMMGECKKADVKELIKAN